MRKWLALSAALLIAGLSYPAMAQAPNVKAVIFPPIPPTSSALYAGPGNVSLSVATVKAWGGLRAYSLAKAGNPAIDICEPTGVTCVTWNTNATTGRLVATSNPVGGTDCTVSTTCTISKIYDQTQLGNCSGTCDWAQATNANRPTFNWNGGNPYLTFVRGNSQDLVTGNVFSQAQPFTVSFVANRNGDTTSLGDVLTMIGAGIQFGYRNATNTILTYCGNLVGGTASDNAFHAVQNVASVASSDSNIDGVQNTVNCGANAPTGVIIGIGGSDNFLTAQFRETGIWAGAFSTTDSSNMSANQHSAANGWNF